MEQPPGKETRAVPKRETRGPRTTTEEFVGCFRRLKACSVQAHGTVAERFVYNAHSFKKLGHGAHVGQIRNVVQHDIVGRQKRRSKNRQCGVFGARSLHLSDKTAAANNRFQFRIRETTATLFQPRTVRSFDSNAAMSAPRLVFAVF